MEFTISSTSQAQIEEVLKKLAKGDDSTTKLRQKCDVAFKDRLVLAKCTASSSKTIGDGGVLDVAIVSHYYRFATVIDSDLFMKQCLQIGGTWDALSRESDDFKRAELQHRLKKVEDLPKKAR